MPPPAADPSCVADPEAVATGLLDRYVNFVQHLRRAGLPVSVAESKDGADVLLGTPLIDRSTLRWGLSAALVKRAGHQAAFDTMFDLWFPAVVGSATWPTTGPRGSRSVDGHAAAPVGGSNGGAGPGGTADSLREELFEGLLAGDDDRLRRLAAAAVTALGRADTQPGRQSWFSYRVVRQLSPETLMARLLAAVLAGQARGGMVEQVERAAFNERIRVFERYVEADVRRRVAEQRGPAAVSRTAVAPLLEEVSFLQANAADMAALRRQVHPLARRLATRLSVRRRHSRRGPIDFRRTVRASLGTGGVPVVTRHRPHRPHKPELVVLCDVSGSVTAFAHFTLMLAFALRNQFTRVRAFAFVDTCDEVTRFFAVGDDVLQVAVRIAREADVVRFDGHSDYGHSFEVFADRYGAALTPKASLLVLGDARNNYRNLALPTLAGMVRRTRHAYWLNPEPRRQWGSADSAALQYGRLMPMTECRNVAQLAEFVSRLLPV